MATSDDKIISLDLSSIIPSPYQGRFISENDRESAPKTATALKELCDSIKKDGVLQPIIVRKVKDKYELIDGHRRFLACKKLEITNIPAILREYNDQQAQLFSIIGNTHRQNLNPLELARTYRKAITSRLYKTQRDLADALGKDEAYIGDIINTLKMDLRILDDIDKKATVSDVRILRAIRRFDEAKDGKSDRQWELYRKIVDGKMTRDEVLKEIKQATGRKAPKKPIEFRWSDKGKGTIKINTAGIEKGHRKEIEKEIDKLMQKYLPKVEKAKK
jgi:ParB family chromosome partitioning protein